eukprot:scaffold17116_cov67-Phaeocystis_antarctica.AAC.2
MGCRGHRGQIPFQTSCVAPSVAQHLGFDDLAVLLEEAAQLYLLDVLGAHHVDTPALLLFLRALGELSLDDHLAPIDHVRARHDTQRHLCRRELHVHDSVLRLPIDVNHAAVASKVRLDLLTREALVHVSDGHLSALLMQLWAWSWRCGRPRS